MKKILLVLFVLLPLGMAAQGKHHFEAGIGYAAPGELLGGELSTKEKGTATFIGEYRYNFTERIGLGLIYSFVPNHKGEPVVTSADETPSYSINTRYHTANLVFEYKLGKFGVFAPFVGIGGGAQYRHATMSHSIYAHNYWSADLYLRAGFEIYDHLRLTAGHFHDLHYPFSSLGSGAPYYYFAVSWAF